MADENSNSSKQTVAEAPIGISIGFWALVLAVLSILAIFSSTSGHAVALIGLLSLPVSFILAIIAIVKKQYGWGICAIIVVVSIIMFTPVGIWLLWGLAIFFGP